MYIFGMGISVHPELCNYIIQLRMKNKLVNLQWCQTSYTVDSWDRK